MGPGQRLLASIPAVDRLLDRPAVQALLVEHDRVLVVAELRRQLDLLRRRILDAETVDDGDVGADRIERELRRALEELGRPRLRRVLNATGVVLHTGLGRAVLPPAALEAWGSQLPGYCSLELDLETGERGERELAVRDLVCRLTGAAMASVVNNNAAATTLTLAALARGREVIVSRGQLVEIGGSFRIPEVMEESGARLVEVGATNRTRLSDYERAIGPETAALMLVHPSNYRVVGFTADVDRRELVALAESHGLPVIEDLGSGALIDYGPYGLEGEPTVRQVLEAGVAVAMFSGDKLLGGPQSGIVVGRTEEVRRIRRHPLYRAFRVDKAILAALEATLKTYLEPERLAETNPTFRMLTLGADALRPRAERLAARLADLPGLTAEARPDVSRPGSGSLPTTTIPTWVAAVRSTDPIHQLARRLRLARPALVARLTGDALVLDPRTLEPEEDDEVVACFRRATEAEETPPAGAPSR